MGEGFLSGLLSWLEVGDAGAASPALLEERYKALQRQVPLLYLIALTNCLGLQIATAGWLRLDFGVATVLSGGVILRLVHWLRTRNRSLPPEVIRRELAKTFWLAGLISLSFCIWGVSVYWSGSREVQTYVVLFGSLAAVGCAYGLSSFPAAARLPLLLLAMPLSVLLVFSPDPGRFAVGVSLGLVGLLLLRLLRVQNRGFSQLVESRAELAVERERSRQAEERALEEKGRAAAIAHTDHLTGLPNRRAFLAELEAQIEEAERTHTPFAIALVDLDGFKPINDTFGHATGDEVLREVGVRLRTAAGPGATIARMGGDEFALLLRECTTKAQAGRIGRAVCAALQWPFSVEGREFRLSGCCGFTLVCEGTGSQALIRGDTALYSAKQQGRGTAAGFSQQMEKFHRRRSAIETALRCSETKEQIELVYQPICDIGDGKVRSFEALARWHSPELGHVSPSEFIPIAEQTKAIAEISDRLLVRAVREALEWPEEIRLSFNLSAVQLCSLHSAQLILDSLRAEGFDPSRLKIEVTETAMLADFETARANLSRLKAADVQVVLDDFGAGHSAISYLREMPFDEVKIDGSLIAPIARSAAAQRLLKGVLDLCRSLGAHCTAEHVETTEQLDILRRLGCASAQGYLMAPPLSARHARLLARVGGAGIEGAAEAAGILARIAPKRAA
jgi:diguanylate cyclase (GGDEF)-like protein